MTLLDEARKLQPEIVELRRHLHAHPELSFEEWKTASVAQEILAGLGYSVRTGIAKTGLVADKGSGARAIGIRADMDALPISEINDVPYKSQNEGIMHACGHDAHVACTMAAAKLLSREELPGKIRVLLQPAEEACDEHGISGAGYMVKDGALEGLDAVIGMHMSALLPAGRIAIPPGPMLAAADSFKITVRGKGGHGGYPESTIDSVVIAAQLIQALQQVVSRRISALEPAVVTVGAINSSSVRGNIISESVEMLGTIRTFSESARMKAFDEVKAACRVAEALGAQVDCDIELGYPATINNEKVASVMRQTIVDLSGAETLVEIKPRMAADDFGILARAVPGAYMLVGAELAGSPRNHHSPTFDIDESGLFVAAAVLAETARRLLSE